MPSLSPIHLIIILVIVLIVIGPGRLPEIGSALGKSIKEFRNSASDTPDPTPQVGPSAISGPAEPRVAIAPVGTNQPVGPTITPGAPLPSSGPVAAPQAPETNPSAQGQDGPGSGS